jgi:hypothetical protein
MPYFLKSGLNLQIPKENRPKHGIAHKKQRELSGFQTVKAIPKNEHKKITNFNKLEQLLNQH